MPRERRARLSAYLLELGDAAVPTLHQVGGLLADVARHFAAVALDEGFGLVSFHGLQNARQYKRATLQTVLGTLEETRDGWRWIKTNA